jgi:multiple sugar transport system ATP-binding protein
MRGELKHLQQKLATTTVYVTHDQAEAMTLGHRVAVMNKGKLQQFDTPLEIYNRPANRFVAEFVGSPSMNFLDGLIDISQGRFRNQHVSLALNDSQRKTLSSIDSNKRVTLGIRPEDIHVSLSQRDDWHPASVYVTELMGSETFVIVQLRDAKLTARAGGDFRAEPDSHLWIEFDTTKRIS